MTQEKFQVIMDHWAKLRFSIIGGLLASPPEYGKLQAALQELAGKRWQHPVTNELITFKWPTLERWYYLAKDSDNPIEALARKTRKDYQQSRVMSPFLMEVLHHQYKDHPSWSYQLHHDNLSAFVSEQSELDKAPSYSTVKLHMKSRGWYPKRRLSGDATSGQKAAYERKEKLEIRSYESPYVHGLWHLDFHVCKRRVVDEKGNWHTPRAFCVMDDRSRVCCHLQWYLSESAQTLVHGLTQAFYKRGLPRALMSDNGGAMRADETRNGLEQLGIIHELTLAYSPYHYVA